MLDLDVTGGSAVKNLPAGSGIQIPSKRIPHVKGQPSPCASTTEDCAPGALALQSEKPSQ